MRGHRENRVELSQSSIQLRYMAFSRDFGDVGISSFDTNLNRWSHVSMPCIFIGSLIKPSSARFSRWPHTVRNLPREAKNIKHVSFYPHGLARRISHLNFPAHVRKRLSKPPREAVCSALSSSVRRALGCNSSRSAAIVCIFKCLDWLGQT